MAKQIIVKVVPSRGPYFPVNVMKDLVAVDAPGQHSCSIRCRIQVDDSSDFKFRRDSKNTLLPTPKQKTRYFKYIIFVTPCHLIFVTPCDEIMR